MLALLASSASAAYKMHLYEDLACTDAPWEISFEGSTCTGDDPFLWTDGDGESLPRPGYYFKNGFRSFQYDPTTTTMNVYSTTDCTGVNYGNTLYDAATSCKADNTQCCQLVNDVEGDFLISYKIEEFVASPPPAPSSPPASPPASPPPASQPPASPPPATQMSPPETSSGGNSGSKSAAAGVITLLVAAALARKA